MDKVEKLGITALITALFSWCGALTVPFLLLVLLNLIDYATGLCAAKYRSERVSSYKSLRGIAKKICMWLLVIVGGAMDWLITYTADTIGLNLEVSFVVAIIVCAWLMCNEVISILENMLDIGVKLPPFLLKLTERIRGSLEDAAELPDDKDSEKKE